MSSKLNELKRIAAARTKGKWHSVWYEDHEGDTACATGPFHKCTDEVDESSGDYIYEAAASKDAEFIAAAANTIDDLIRVVEAAEHRLATGHNDTCQYALFSEYTCNCGHEELARALKPFRERENE
jgi:hypothetical protein